MTTKKRIIISKGIGRTTAAASGNAGGVRVVVARPVTTSSCSDSIGVFVYFLSRGLNLILMSHYYGSTFWFCSMFRVVVCLVLLFAPITFTWSYFFWYHSLHFLVQQMMRVPVRPSVISVERASDGRAYLQGTRYEVPDGGPYLSIRGWKLACFWSVAICRVVSVVSWNPTYPSQQTVTQTTVLLLMIYFFFHWYFQNKSDKKNIYTGICLFLKYKRKRQTCNL
jgi:hypothetical protein